MLTDIAARLVLRVTEWLNVSTRSGPYSRCNAKDGRSASAVIAVEADRKTSRTSNVLVLYPQVYLSSTPPLFTYTHTDWFSLTVPNPINGCMCHVIDLCTCVSYDLQDTSVSSAPVLSKECKIENEDGKAVFDPTLIDTLHTFTNTEDNGPPPVVDQDIWNSVMGDIDIICDNRSHLK